MAHVEMDLSKYKDALGGHPERFFVDEHDHVYRVVEHATGAVCGVLKPNGTLGPYRPATNPDAPPIVVEIVPEAGPASHSNKG